MIKALIAEYHVQVRGIDSLRDHVIVETQIAQDHVQARGINSLRDHVLAEALVAQDHVLVEALIVANSLYPVHTHTVYSTYTYSIQYIHIQYTIHTHTVYSTYTYLTVKSKGPVQELGRHLTSNSELFSTHKHIPGKTGQYTK